MEVERRSSERTLANYELALRQLREWRTPFVFVGNNEYAMDGLRRINAIRELQPSDIILHGDLDEVCRPLHVRNVRPRDTFITFEQRLHCFAVDWLHPDPWGGTVAATLEQFAGLGKWLVQPASA